MKVLVIEDDATSRRLVELGLRDRGHEVVTFGNAEDAMEAFKREPFPLVVLDLMLPGMDGLAFCRWLRARPGGEATYILVSTGCNHPDDLQAVLDAGANDYLSKPFETRLFQVRISVAEQQLLDFQKRREVEELHQTILRTALDGFWILDTDGRLLEVNDAYCRLSGYEREELLNRTARELSPVDDPDQIMTFIELALERGTATLETQHLRKDGVPVFLDISMRHLPLRGGRLFVFLKDITDRKRAEQALQNRVRIQSSIAEISSSFIDVHSEQIDEALTDALRRLTSFCDTDVCSLFLVNEDNRHLAVTHQHTTANITTRGGLPVIDIRRYPWIAARLVAQEGFSFSDPDELPEEADVEKALFRSFGIHSILAVPLSSGRAAFGFLALSRVRGGHRFTADEETVLTLAAPIMVHAIERKRIAEDKEKLAAFPKYNPNLVLEFTPDGKLSYFNAAARALAQDLRKSFVSEILPPQTPAIVRECFERNETRTDIETRYGARTISWSFFPIPAIRAVHCYAAEITYQLSIEDQLRHSQKMESIGQLAAGVAHDFNNVLTVIEGHAGLLLSEPALAPAALESVGQIAAAAGRAANLTRQLLTFSRRQVIQPKLIDLNDVIRNVTRMLERLLGEDIKIEINFGGELPAVNADTGMMEQVLINLAVNARDAMPRGGRLEVRTDLYLVNAETSAHHPEANPGSYVRLSVTDTGCGIDPENLQRIFEPFYTTKAIGKGTGLGLATVYGILRQHDGFVQVYSEKDRGTVFHCNLPAVKNQSPGHDTTITPRKVAGGTERILVVEDEPALRALAGQILKRFGYHVTTAESGVHALKVWDEHAGEFDLLLTDMVMPEGVSGSELAERLRRKKPDLRVIYSSGYSQEIAGHDLTLENGFDFLQKPYHPMKLAELVRESLDRL